MWGLFAIEDIDKGAFLCEYKGEIVTKKKWGHAWILL
jgi:SET domain-containing protein